MEFFFDHPAQRIKLHQDDKCKTILHPRFFLLEITHPCHSFFCNILVDVNKTLLNESLSETTYSTISQVNSIKHNEIKVNYSQYPVVRVSYNEVPGYCALVARAIDEDEGRNAQLRYGITRQYSYITQQGLKDENVLDAFTMDQPSGRVMLTRSLNLNELGSYEMIITVEDNGEPVQRAEKVNN